jgi:cell volume regulation protein A
VSLELMLGISAGVLLLGVLAVRVSVRLGLPSLLLYLGIGVLLGESVLASGSTTPASPSPSASPRSC